MEVDWANAPENATHAMTTSIDWNGGDLLTSTIRFAYTFDDIYWDCKKDGTSFCIGRTAWRVLEPRPEPEVQSCCGTTCNKIQLEKELRIKGAKEFYKLTLTDEKDLPDLLKEYIDYVMHEE